MDKKDVISEESGNVSLALVSLVSFIFFTSLFVLLYSVTTSQTEPEPPLTSKAPLPIELKAKDTKSKKAENKIQKDIPAIEEPLFFADAALEDPENLIHKSFKVPKGLKYRTEFWFKVYTKWDSYNHIIHHVDFPWLVFEVVNTERFFKSKRPYITQVHNAKRFVDQRKKIIRKNLLSLSKYRSYKKLSPLKEKLHLVISQIPGSKKRNLRLASQKVRSQLGQKNFFEFALKNSTKYLSHMENTFARYGLPEELTRLPFVESSFNEKAVSKVGASGVWQIMPRTGKQYLRVGKYIDERNSPLKATRSSAIQLKRDFKILGNWPLAVTAYNHGVGSMRKAVRALKTDNFGKIIARYHAKSFGFASQNFYTCFLAALHAEKYADKIFDVKRSKPYDIVRVKLKKPIRLKTLAKTAGLSLKELIKYNLDLKKAVKKNLRLGRGFSIYLPRAIVAQFKSNVKNKIAVQKS